MGRRQTAVLLVLLLVASLLGGAAAGQVEVPGVPKVEFEPAAPGFPDPPDPPYVDPLRLYELPEYAEEAHPRLLFSTADLPEIRERIAEEGSVAQQAWGRLVAWGDAYTVGDPIADYPDRNFGRDDLAGLGLLWHVTEDPGQARVYLEKAKELLDYVLLTAPDYGAPKAPDCCEYYIRRAHKLNGLALAYDILHPGLDDAQRTRLLNAILTLGGEHFAHTFSAWWGTISTGSNITGNNAAAVGTAGLAIWGDVPAPTPQLWVARSSQLVRSYFVEGFDRNGAGLEGVLYGNYGLRIPTFFAHALGRAGAEDLFETGTAHLQQEWVAYEVLPGGGAVNPLNDARYHEINPVHLTWASRYGHDPDLAGWIWEQLFGTEPMRSKYRLGELLPTVLWHEPPDPAFSPERTRPHTRIFPDRGLVHVRSGWGDGDLMASFEARQNDWGEGVHHNQDVNAFTLYAHGARLAIDSGYANWLSKMTAGDFEAAASSETQAHNAVVADGRSQDFHTKGDLRLAATTATSSHAGRLDLAVGDARLGYLTDQPERADRYFLHVRSADGLPDYLVVSDAFRQGGGDHEYSWFLHTEPGNTLATEPVDGTAVSRVDAPNGAGLEITQVASDPLEPVVGSFTADYDDIGTHPRLEVTASGEALESIAVLQPTDTGETSPPVASIETDGGVGAQVDHGGSVDTLLLRTGETAVADGVSTDGAFAFLRRGGDGGPGVLALAEGTELRADGRPLVLLDAVGTVLTSPRRVVIEGDVGSLLVWAPGTPTVVVNGERVDAEHCGPYVAYGRPCPGVS